MFEYGILDDEGKVFGLRGTTYTSLEAAEKALEFLRARRRAMEVEAVAAKEELDKHLWDNETAGRQRHLEDAVARWENEKNRTFVLRRREVGAWLPV